MDANIVWGAIHVYKDKKNNLRRAINEKLNLVVPNVYKSNVMEAVGQGRNYLANADHCAIINTLHIRYGNPTPNNKRLNKADFSTAWNVAMPIEYYFFCLEEFYMTV